MRDRNLLILAFYCLFAGIVLGFVIAHVVKIPSFCLANDTHCIRDWAAALSGYAAGIAAIFAAGLTVRAILRQSRESREQHEEFMKFEAFERLLLVEQVGNAASNAFGTVTQIFHEFHDDAIPRNVEKLKLYIDAANHALQSLSAIQFSEKRAGAQGNLPPTEMRAENALPDFIKYATAASLLSDRTLAAGGDRGLLRAASTYLMMAHEDLRSLADEMHRFRKRWAHLSA